MDERDRQLDLARFHAARAAEIDPSLAWFAGTVANFNTWRDQASIWVYSYVGEHEKAITRARRSVELDPRNWNPLFALSVALHYAGEAGESARIFREAIAMAPAAPVLAYSYARIGRRADAERITAEIEQTPDVEIGTGGWTMVYLARGDRARSAQQLETAIAKIESRNSSAYATDYAATRQTRRRHLGSVGRSSNRLEDITRKVRH